MNFCTHCGAPLKQVIPDGDDRLRHVCRACRAVHYVNPKIVVGCIPEYGERILMCRRAIQPSSGLWTIPAGFLEHGETVADGAKRETLEETAAAVEIVSLYILIDLPKIGQVYLIFRARMMNGHYGPGHESTEVKLFQEEDIPWDEIAFPSIEESLRLYFQDRRTGEFPLRMAKIRV
jgi:ADP-ribose pyrophosphatase YjhB (NUDIX family)